MEENEMYDIFNEALETIEPLEDYNSYSEILENDLGQSFDSVEVKEWQSLVESAKSLIETGELNQDTALETIQGVFGEYLKERDIEAAFDQGIKPEDISKEAFELWAQNIGKMNIAQAMEKVDPFLDGFENGANKTRSYRRVTPRKVNPFLEGFDSYGK